MSHVQVNSSVVINTCEKVILTILEEREIKWKEYVSQQNTWYNRIAANIQGISLEDMLEDTHEGFCMKHFRYNTIQDCKTLITLAKLGTPVTITTEHAYIFADL